MTSVPAASARATVESLQLSATTITRSAGRVCARRDARVSGSDASSLCAGTSTVTVTGPANSPRVLSITIRGASGVARTLVERREIVVIRHSNRASPPAASSATATAATSTATAGTSTS